MKKIFLLCLVFVTACNNGVDFKLPEQSQNFAQKITYNNKVDILFIVDNSPSMIAVQTFLYQQLPALIDSVQKLKMDYHIGVVSSTMLKKISTSGRLIGEPKFLDSETTDLYSVLKDRIIIGQNGSVIEQGLDAMENVLSDSYQMAEGRGFLRSDAFLNIITISNEDDESVNGWQHYAERLDKMRPNYEDGTKAWAYHFFGVISFDDECPSSDWNLYKSPGFKHLELVKYSNGVSQSICGQDLFKSLSQIKARITQVLTDYKLSYKPDLTSIKVYLNNNLIPADEKNGWSYIKESNVIRFNGSFVPAADDDIRVDFKPAEAN